MMKKIILAFLTIGMMVLGTNEMSAQTNTDAAETTNVYAKLIKPMTITEVADMDFGTIVLTNTTATTVVLNTDGTRTYNSPAEAAVGATQSPNVASYTVTGTPLQTYAITFSATNTLTHTSVGAGVNTMTLTAIKFSRDSGTTDVTTGTLDVSGDDAFVAGGTLNIQENQIAGQYAGTFVVTVDYN